jgi:Xaa-Pro dipeptidase
MINHARLAGLLENLDLAAVVAVSPENTHYLSSVFIRTQVSIRDRIACVIWPRSAPPTFLVCDIEESLARAEGTIEDVRTYVEFAQSPVGRLVEIVRDRGLSDRRLGVETRYLSVEQMADLRAALPQAEFVPLDDELAQVRAVKTAAEAARITAAYLATERIIREAWSRCGEGDTERTVANRMIETALARGAEGVRHLTLSSGENTVHPHMTPGHRVLAAGDTFLTDVGFFFDGFASDMARTGTVGRPSDEQRREYDAYRAAYVRLLQRIEPGMRASEVYRSCRDDLARAGYPLALPHVGHGLSRRGGHEAPILHPYNEMPLEPGMLLAIEPGFRPRPDRRYHLEDLVMVTASGAQVLTDWESTEAMLQLATA